MITTGAWSEPDPADMSDTRLPKDGTFCFVWGADPGPTGETFLDLVACGREAAEEPVLRVGGAGRGG